MNKLLDEWLRETNSRIDWNYWTYSEDFHALREWYGAEGAKEYYHVEKWYEAAIEYDAERYHNQSPDFIAWQRPFWTVDQATALLLGKDPDSIDPDQIKADEDRSIFAWFYSRLRGLIVQAQKEKDLPDQIRPRILLEWADVDRIRYPDDLRKAAADIDSEAEDYKWLYNSKRDENDRLRVEIDRLRSEIESLAHQKEALSPVADNSPRQSDWTRERNTLLTILLAMAAKRFGYKRGKSYQTTARSIEGATTELGATITAQTILGKLRDAETLVGEAESAEAKRDKRAPKSGS